MMGGVRKRRIAIVSSLDLAFERGGFFKYLENIASFFYKHKNAPLVVDYA